MNRSAGFCLCALDAFDVLSAPIAQWPEGLNERGTELGEGILDARRDLSKVPPRNDSV